MSSIQVSGRDLTKSKHLPREEQLRLIALAQKGDIQARDEIFESSFKLVMYVINVHLKQHGDPEDLFQSGCIGLLKAIVNFDLESGHSFSSYAVPMIFGHAQRFAHKNRLFQVPRSIRERQTLVLAKFQEIEHTGTMQKDYEEIAKQLGLSLQDVLDVLLSLWPLESLSHPHTHNGLEMSYADFLVDDTDYECIDTIIMINTAVSALPIQDQELIQAHFYNGETQKDIADRLGCSQSHVSRKLHRIKTNIRKEIGGLSDEG